MKPQLLLAGLAFLLAGQAAADATLERITSTGIIRVGITPNAPPWGYVDVNTQQPAGFDVDLAKDNHWPFLLPTLETLQRQVKEGKI